MAALAATAICASATINVSSTAGIIKPLNQTVILLIALGHFHICFRTLKVSAPIDVVEAPPISSEALA